VISHIMIRIAAVQLIDSAVSCALHDFMDTIAGKVVPCTELNLRMACHKLSAPDEFKPNCLNWPIHDNHQLHYDS